MGHGFNRELTLRIVKGLLSAGIKDIELGNCKGLGAYTLNDATKACSDEEYLDMIQPFLPQGRIGMFLLASNGEKAPVELAAATLKKEGYLPDVDLYALLDYLDRELIPAMEPWGCHVAVNPTDLMLGLAGCHSNNLPMLRSVAQEEGVSLLLLIEQVSTVNRKNPDRELALKTAAALKN